MRNFENSHESDPMREEKPQDLNRAVAVEGKYLGREVGEFSLRGFSRKGQDEGAAMLGNDAFTEIYFETMSGNVYKIFRERVPGKGGEWMIADVRSNAGRENDLRGSFLSEEDLENGILSVGRSFHYGKGGQTTDISKITCVNANRIYQSAYLDEYTEGKTSDVRNIFTQKLAPKTKK